MAVTLRDSFYTPKVPNQAQLVFGTASVKAQTFTPATNYTIVSVTLQLYRSGTPGIATIEIRTTSGGKPTTTVLCSGTTDGDTLATGTPYTDRNITLGAGTPLTAGQLYAIVIKAPSGTGISKCINWNCNDGSLYSDGKTDSSSDGGATWGTPSLTTDCLFKVYADSFYNEGNLIISATATETGRAFDVEGQSVIIAEAHSLLASEDYAPWYWGIGKPIGFDPNKTFDEVTQTWIAPNGKGGGRFSTAILIIAQANDSVDGLLFYNEI
jgi:hypothetical protein